MSARDKLTVLVNRSRTQKIKNTIAKRMIPIGWVDTDLFNIYAINKIEIPFVIESADKDPA